MVACREGDRNEDNRPPDNEDSGSGSQLGRLHPSRLARRERPIVRRHYLR